MNVLKKKICAKLCAKILTDLINVHANQAINYTQTQDLVSVNKYKLNFNSRNLFFLKFKRY